MESNSSLKTFLKEHFYHYNSGALVRAAEDYVRHIDRGGKMMVTLAGAMSSARLGKILAPMIRAGKVHAISTTGANLEEDVYRLIAFKHYAHIPHYRMSAKDEEKLLDQSFNRVTDLAIPEHEAMRVLEERLHGVWKAAEAEQAKVAHNAPISEKLTKGRYFPHEYLYKILQQKDLPIDGHREESWVLACMEKNIPIFTPGWEDSTSGNMFIAAIRKGVIQNPLTVRDGKEAFNSLADWYIEESAKSPIGFFQVGGGIAGDYPICVVPMLRQDMEIEVPLWSYFAQIRDSHESYGGYSGAYPTEKITWGKLDASSAMHDIVSDATICAPLVFAYVMGY
ncbi:MAG: deoxyhypusine synthase family protein [Proteobacteria bacterium]|jgi:deoxyhypusine synthase|nr:deoxyhypusine synthase family protein [Pseudomonadota bacterium]